MLWSIHDRYLTYQIITGKTRNQNYWYILFIMSLSKGCSRRSTAICLSSFSYNFVHTYLGVGMISKARDTFECWDFFCSDIVPRLALKFFLKEDLCWKEASSLERGRLRKLTKSIFQHLSQGFPERQHATIHTTSPMEQMVLRKRVSMTSIMSSSCTSEDTTTPLPGSSHIEQRATCFPMNMNKVEFLLGLIYCSTGYSCTHPNSVTSILVSIFTSLAIHISFFNKIRTVWKNYSAYKNKKGMQFLPLHPFSKTGKAKQMALYTELWSSPQFSVMIGSCRKSKGWMEEEKQVENGVQRLTWEEGKGRWKEIHARRNKRNHKSWEAGREASWTAGCIWRCRYVGVRHRSSASSQLDP